MTVYRVDVSCCGLIAMTFIGGDGIWGASRESRWRTPLTGHPDAEYTEPDDPAAEWAAWRARHNIRCKHCRRSLSVRGENLASILDTLAAHGVAAITITGLAARVS